MYCGSNGAMMISFEEHSAAGKAVGVIHHAAHSPDLPVPTHLPANGWQSTVMSTLGPQFTAAPKFASTVPKSGPW
jgi:hypothetical protein